MEMHMSCSENLSTGDQRSFVRHFLTRATPGIRFVFMQGGRLREGVKITRTRSKLIVSI
ncbi:hypothetical protein [Salinibacter phage M8CC-19]|uniref:Uncharacterized protein n=2 Tax=Kryptosalinivirus M8CC19 TaxID=2560720 RepID=A0A2I6UGB1_9CAUD|nr:hypothetical protein FGG63_gp11 [Salinibacter phage M8CC-19]AUO79022.1 hypothetical protein [Salinibacter phage M8CC-19]AUO79255.1 hypothetical protein [Salinibacter phage M31CC-1]